MSVMSIFESKRVNKIPVGRQIELCSYSYGEGTPIIFLTNFFMVCKYWSQFIGNIAENHRVITFDFRNQGGSSRVRNVTLKDYEEDILAVMDYYKIKSAVIVGSSTAASVARDFTLSYPDRVEGNIFVGPVFTPYGAARRKSLVKSWLNTLEHSGVSGVFDHIYPLVYTSRLIEHNGAISYMVFKSSFKKNIDKDQLKENITCSLQLDDSPQKLMKLSKPYRIVVGESDFFTSISDAEALVGLSKESSLSVLKNSGHIPFFEANEDFQSAILEFSSSISKKQ